MLQRPSTFDAFVHSFTHLLIHSFTHSFIHSLIHSLTDSRARRSSSGDKSRNSNTTSSSLICTFLNNSKGCCKKRRCGTGKKRKKELGGLGQTRSRQRMRAHVSLRLTFGARTLPLRTGLTPRTNPCFCIPDSCPMAKGEARGAEAPVRTPAANHTAAAACDATAACASATGIRERADRDAADGSTAGDDPLPRAAAAAGGGAATVAASV